MWRVQRTRVCAFEVSRSSRRCDGHACRPNYHAHAHAHARAHAFAHARARTRAHYCVYGHVRLKRTRVWENVLLELIALARNGERDRGDHRVRKHAESAQAAPHGAPRRSHRRHCPEIDAETGRGRTATDASGAAAPMESKPHRIASNRRLCRCGHVTSQPSPPLAACRSHVRGWAASARLLEHLPISHLSTCSRETARRLTVTRAANAEAARSAPALARQCRMPKRARSAPPVRVPPCARVRVRAPRRACEEAAAHIARALRQHARATLRVLRAEFGHVVLVRRLIFQLEVPAGWRRGEVVAPRIAPLWAVTTLAALLSCDGASTAPGRGAAAPAVVAWRKGIRRSVSTPPALPEAEYPSTACPLKYPPATPAGGSCCLSSAFVPPFHFWALRRTGAVRYNSHHEQRRAQSRRRCGSGAPSPGADVAAVCPVPVQMWQRCAQSRRRCGSGAPSPGADVAAVCPVPAQMWQRCAQSRRRCGSGEPGPGVDAAGMSPSPGADVAGVSPVAVQMWAGRRTGCWRRPSPRGTRATCPHRRTA